MPFGICEAAPNRKVGGELDKAVKACAPLDKILIMGRFASPVPAEQQLSRLLVTRHPNYTSLVVGYLIICPTHPPKEGQAMSSSSCLYVAIVTASPLHCPFMYNVKPASLSHVDIGVDIEL